MLPFLKYLLQDLLESIEDLVISYWQFMFTILLVTLLLELCFDRFWSHFDRLALLDRTNARTSDFGHIWTTWIDRSQQESRMA